MDLKVSNLGNSHYALLPKYVYEKYAKDGIIRMIPEEEAVKPTDFREIIHEELEKIFADRQSNW